MVKSAIELRNSITKERIETVKTYLKARAYRETIEPIVKRYQRAILAENQWKIAKEHAEKGRENEIILVNLTTVC